ncbi:M48 family metallopeptidase [Massilia sp. Root351]|uniref:M48 family metallopeptidase n=1 Tax=Massilia sp. Root351 TaxID=1736522 RepID=UPI001E3ABC28|nr:SprT family zinc-dependent metalloprotease [Massilia sp. Root351]
MDRIRNARHFAPRLQRWLEDLATAARPAASKADEGQLDLFGESAPGVASRPAGPAANAAVMHQPSSPVPVPAPSTWQAPRPVSPASVSPASAIPGPPGPASQSDAAPSRAAAGDASATHAPPSANLLRPPPVPVRTPEPPAPEVDALPRRQLLVGQFILEYTLRRSTRRSIGFMIDDEGLRVTAPKRVSLAEIDNAIRAKQHWIISKLDERRERRAARLQKPPVAWEDGAVLPYLGGELKLRLYTATRNRTDYNADTRELHMGLVQGATETLLKERVRAWMQQQAKVLFEQRLDLYAARLGVEYSAFALSSAGTRWGSCTVQRVIRLNWRLIHFSLPLIDYVVAHELAHILEMNHSAKFWSAVGRIYPAYDDAKALLRKRAQELPVLFS